MTRSPEERLEHAVDVARRLHLAPAVIARAVRGVEHAAATRPARIGGWMWAAVGVVTPLLAVAVFVPPWTATEPRPAPTPAVHRLDAHFALAIAEALYSTDWPTRDILRVGVEDGAVALRLMGDGRSAEIVLRGTAVHTRDGTVAAGIIEGRTIVHVFAGSAVVLSSAGRALLASGQAWVDGRVDTAPAPHPELGGLARALAEIPAPPRGNADRPAAEAPSPEDGEVPRRRARVDPTEQQAPTSSAERWRAAREHIRAGRARRAAVELRVLAESDDATWAPLAAAERARLLADTLSLHAQAVSVAETFMVRFPTHPLRLEVAEVRCRSLRALGRASGDCQGTSQPMPARRSTTPR